MELESLDQLKNAYVNWRKNKRHIREAVPADLLESTRRAAMKFGTSAVSRAIKMDWERMSKKKSRSISSSSRKNATVIPAYSRLPPLPPSLSVNHPLAEIESPSGMKLRIYSSGSEALALLSTFCSTGGAL